MSVDLLAFLNWNFGMVFKCKPQKNFTEDIRQWREYGGKEGVFGIWFIGGCIIEDVE